MRSVCAAYAQRMRPRELTSGRAGALLRPAHSSNETCTQLNVASIPRTGRARVSIHQQTSAYISIRLSLLHVSSIPRTGRARVSIRQHTSTYVSIRLSLLHVSSILRTGGARVSIRQHTSAYVSLARVKYSSHRSRSPTRIIQSFVRKPNVSVQGD